MDESTKAKRSKPRPNRRQQAFVFVEPYKNPIKESKLPETKHLVKKWSMLNRKNDATASNGSKAFRPTEGIEARRRSYVLPSRTYTQDEYSANSESTDGEEGTENREGEKELVRRRPGIESFRDVLSCRLDDPFSVLPIPIKGRSFGLLHQYLTCHCVESRPWFRADDEYGSLLVDARRQTWFPVAIESEAACTALVALMAASSPFESDFATLRDTYLGAAFRLTNKELTSERSCGNSTMLAVVMLMVAALMMEDEQAFESHSKGVSSLLVHRSRHPERAGRYIKPQWYTFSPSAAYQNLSFSGTGIRKLAKQGFISQAAWSAYFKEAMTLSSLILLTPGDTFWFSAMAQHKWLAGNPDTLGAIPLDAVFHSTLRLAWHLIVWQGSLLNSPIIAGTILEIYNSLNRCDVETLLLNQPEAVIWIALTAGPYSLNLQSWFQVMLRLSLAASGIGGFNEAIKVLAQQYLWHPNMNANAEKFWRQNSTQTTPRACCKTALESKQRIEAQFLASYEALHLDEDFQPQLQTQNTKCRRCLCAWWL